MKHFLKFAQFLPVFLLSLADPVTTLPYPRKCRNPQNPKLLFDIILQPELYLTAPAVLTTSDKVAIVGYNDDSITAYTLDMNGTIVDELRRDSFGLLGVGGGSATEGKLLLRDTRDANSLSVLEVEGAKSRVTQDVNNVEVLDWYAVVGDRDVVTFSHPENTEHKILHRLTPTTTTSYTTVWQFDPTEQQVARPPSPSPDPTDEPESPSPFEFPSNMEPSNGTFATYDWDRGVIYAVGRNDIREFALFLVNVTDGTLIRSIILPLPTQGPGAFPRIHTIDHLTLSPTRNSLYITFSFQSVMYTPEGVLAIVTNPITVGANVQTGAIGWEVAGRNSTMEGDVSTGGSGIADPGEGHDAKVESQAITSNGRYLVQILLVDNGRSLVIYDTCRTDRQRKTVDIGETVLWGRVVAVEGRGGGRFWYVGSAGNGVVVRGYDAGRDRAGCAV